MATPKSVRIRSYDVGFGDCFLLTFDYSPTDRRHVLIDFGSFPKPKRKNAGDMTAIAGHIAQECGKDLRAVVATHRHADHVSGFARKKGGNGSGDIIRSLKPDLVIQPWTEHPQLDPQAKGLGNFAPADKQRVAALTDVQGFLRGVVSYATAARGWSPALRRELGFLGQNGLGNKSAVENLMTMATAKSGQKYVRFGSPLGLSKVLPGVKVTVLGPPTIEQQTTVEKQRREDTTEFWHLFAAAAPQPPGARGKGPFPARYALASIPGTARWLKDHADKMLRQQLLAIVRRMDDALNNTSVILLFEVGKKKLLFPGDAQIENWSFALGKKDVQKLLADVDVYKVGHHGSLNATPKKSLWAKFKKKGKGPNSLRTFMSTESGHHGTRGKTEVPRGPLVQELEARSRLTTTNLKAADRDPKKGKVQRDKTVTWVEETIKV
ncbi:MAG TPA: MBL fold metallo-hydrolase [Thermoanaerobaculia bacterium]